VKSSVREIVSTLMQEIGGIAAETIRDDAAIDGELEMNSVTFVELQVALEDELDVLIDPVEVVERNRFGAIVAYLEGLVAERSA